MAESLQTRKKTPTLLHDMAVTRERVSEQLKALRVLHGTADKPLSQEKAAQKAKVSTRDWNRWERMHVTPHTSSLGQVAEAFEVALDTFDDGKVDRSTTPLSDRLEAIEEKLDLILERLSDEPEELARAFEQASEAAPPSLARKRASKSKSRAAPKPTG